MSTVSDIYGSYTAKVLSGAGMMAEASGPALRQLLDSGGLNRWVMDRDCVNHRFRDAYTELALRPNQMPGDADWNDMPLEDY